MIRALKVLIAFAQAYLFYPVMIGLFLYVYFNDMHWGFGLAIIVFILVFDRTWQMLGREFIRKIRNRR